MDEELDPQIKLKLQEVSRAAEPDYPDVKKGIGCGAAALAAGILFGIFAVSFFQKLSFLSKFSMVTGIALIAALIAGGIAAFRPPSK
jgi:hypothetical protein